MMLFTKGTELTIFGQLQILMMFSINLNLKSFRLLWLGPPWFNYWFSFTLAYSRISHEYSSLFIIVINLIFMFSL